MIQRSSFKLTPNYQPLILWQADKYTVVSLYISKAAWGCPIKKSKQAVQQEFRPEFIP